MARLYVWDRDVDTIYVTNFEKGFDVNEMCVYKLFKQN